MKAIKTRYGATVELLINSDDDTADTATLTVGLEGVTPIITKTASFASGVADVSLTDTDTAIPLGEYKYQITVEYTDGRVKKFPEPNTCGGKLPIFEVVEALDSQEVS